MQQKAVRTAVAKAFKRRTVPLRKGHWRLAAAGEDAVTWFVDLRSEGPSPDAAMRLEVGAWVPSLTPEPEGGAVDCSLLADVPLDTGADVSEQVDALVDLLQAVPDVEALRALVREQRLAGAHVDASLRALLGT